MKTRFLKTTLAASLLAHVFASCSSDNLTPVDPPGNVIEGTVITGEITEDLLVPSGNYTLRGVVIVKNGATLTIEKGSHITVTANDQLAGINLLAVEQGGRLIADGTAGDPIIFTSQNQTPGDWGGITLHGKGIINVAGGSSLSEAGQLPYGGINDADSSGILRYVRVEYAGQAVSDGTSEYNAFSFFGIGSGTILEYLEAYKGADDGFEFFGGAAHASNLIAVDCEDDSIDWDQGYRGELTNVLIHQSNGVGDFAFELSNRNGEFNVTPRSKAIVSDVTIRANAKAGKAAFMLKEGTGGIFNNIVVTNVETAIFLNNQLQEAENGELEFTNANLSYSANLLVSNVPGADVLMLAPQFISENPAAIGANASFAAGWSRYHMEGLGQ
jgi:hypothetical protein